jgi:hypothetical protein
LAASTSDISDKNLGQYPTIDKAGKTGEDRQFPSRDLI